MLAWQLRAADIPHSREYRFAPPRRFRADFYVRGRWADSDDARKGLLVEVDGGAFVGGRHSTGTGMENDCEKASLAAVAGYRVIRCTPRQVKSGECLRWIEQAR